MRKVYLLIVTLIVSSCGHPPPTDEVMINNFKANKGVFLKLQELMCRDGFKVVSKEPEWSDPKNIDELKKAEYYKLFEHIDVEQILSDEQCSRLRFGTWTVGFLEGDYKGYVYKPDLQFDSSKNPVHIVPDLDNLKLDSRNSSFFLRPIDGDWYLYYDHWT